MRRSISYISLLTIAAMLQGCSGGNDSNAGAAGESNAVTQTRMDDIDSLQGSISDEMIITDEATDEGALETAESGPADADKPASTDKSTDSAADKAKDTETRGTAD